MFSQAEIDYLRSQPVARLATVNADGGPDVTPVAFEFDGTGFWIGGGATVTGTRKMRNVADGRCEVSLVIDDLVSLDPFVARGVRVYGVAGAPVARTGMVGPGTFFRVTPTVSWSWNLMGEPVGQEWYSVARTEHSPPA